MKLAKRNNINILGGYKAEQSSEHAFMKKLLTLLIIGAGVTAFAQQDIQFTQFMNNRLYYNPGVAGSSGNICVTGVHRTQWAGFDGAPTTQNINAEIPIEILHGAVSVNFVNDAIGHFNNQIFGLGYAYQTNLSNGGQLGVGIQVNISTMSVTNGAWNPPTQGPDPVIVLPGTSGLAIDGAFGIYYQKGPLWAGVSAQRLLGSAMELDSREPSQVTELKNVRHYFIMGGYDIPLQNTDIVLTPSAMVKFDESALNPQADINISARYNNKIWGGVTYRIDDAIAIMAGYEIIPSLRVAYSYDLTTSDLNTASSGSHEITASYCFKIEIPERVRGKHANPIFLL